MRRATEKFRGATEKMSVEETLSQLAYVQSRLASLMPRIEASLALPAGASVLDVGAAQGVAVSVLREQGYEAVGVDPSADALEAAQAISAEAGLDARVVEGSAESLPFEDNSFDLVISLSVLEHVDDPAVATAEAARVLKPGGGFYFYSTSALCPRQGEIRYFPLFPWYPDSVRKRIMHWAARERPSFVNGTTRPALHWFTPSLVEQLAADAGFTRVLDRWEIRAAEDEGGRRGRAISAIASNRALALAADIAVADSAYLLVK